MYKLMARELKVLRASVEICEAHQAGLGFGPLHSLIEDSNYEGDLGYHRKQTETDYETGNCSLAVRNQSLRCLDVLDPLSDEERLAAEWVWLRVLRWDSWNILEEPF